MRDVAQPEYTDALGRPLPADDPFDLYAKEITLSRDASSLHIAFAQCVEQMLAPEGELSTIPDWGGKLVGAVIRIAGLLHIAEHMSKQSKWSEPIAAETMRNAIRVGEYLIPHCASFFHSNGHRRFDRRGETGMGLDQ